MMMKESETDRLVQLAMEIVKVARQEDEALRPLGKSIFDVPEVAFVYLVGKAISVGRGHIFGELDVTWDQEKSVDGKLGASDLILSPKSGNPIVVEFKTLNASSKEIEHDMRKLRQISPNYDRLFCHLMNPWGDSLNRHHGIEVVERRCGVPISQRVYDFPSERYAFATGHIEGDRPWWCVVGVWKII